MRTWLVWIGLVHKICEQGPSTANSFNFVTELCIEQHANVLSIHQAQTKDVISELVLTSQVFNVISIDYVSILDDVSWFERIESVQVCVQVDLIITLYLLLPPGYDQIDIGYVCLCHLQEEHLLEVRYRKYHSDESGNQHHCRDSNLVRSRFLGLCGPDTP